MVASRSHNGGWRKRECATNPSRCIRRQLRNGSGLNARRCGPHDHAASLEPIKFAQSSAAPTARPLDAKSISHSMMVRRSAAEQPRLAARW